MRIVKVEPMTNADIAHHMFAYGCEEPVKTDGPWNCGGVACKSQQSILFAWGRNAPALELPNGKLLHHCFIL
jgi:peptidylglycine monooxygenase